MATAVQGRSVGILCQPPCEYEEKTIGSRDLTCLIRSGLKVWLKLEKKSGPEQRSTYSYVIFPVHFKGHGNSDNGGRVSLALSGEVRRMRRRGRRSRACSSTGAHTVLLVNTVSLHCIDGRVLWIRANCLATDVSP